MRFWRRWSPWRLREALRNQRDWMRDERGIQDGDHLDTRVERLYRHADGALNGERDPMAHAMRYRVEGRTLVIDATPEGSMYKAWVRDGGEEKSA